MTENKQPLFPMLKAGNDASVVGATGPTNQFTPREETFSETLSRSRIDTAGLAAGLQDTLIPLIQRQLDTEYAPQPGYDVDVERWKKDAELVDPDLRIDLLGSRSFSEYTARLADARITTESRRILADRGYGGVVAGVAAQVLAPENIATLGLGAVAGGVRGVKAGLTAFSVAQNFSQAALSDNITAVDALGGVAGDASFFLAMSKFGKAGAATRALAGGASQAVPNALATAVQEDRGLAEVGAAAGLSFMMGGIFGAATPAPRTPAAALHDKALITYGQRLAEIGSEVSITGKAPPLPTDKFDWATTYVGHFDEQTIAEWKNPSGPVAVESVSKPMTVDPSFTGTFRAGGENPTTNAPLQNPYRREDFELGDIDGSRINVAGEGQTTLKIGKLDTRIPFSLNPTNWITASGDELARAYANIVGTQLAPRKDMTANYGVVAQRDDFVRRRRLVYTQAFNSNYDTYVQRVKQSNGQPMGLLDFSKQVTDAVESRRRPELLQRYEPEVVAMADVQAKMQKEDFEFALRHRGLELPKETDDSYMTHLWSRQGLDKLSKELGSEEAINFISRAIERELEVNVDEGVLFPDLARTDVLEKNQKVAQNIAKRIMQVGGRRGGISRLGGLTAAELREELEDTLGKLDDADFDHIKAALIEKKEDANPRFRSRLPIDSLYSEEINGQTYSIRDLLERDANALYSKYSFRMGSDAALAETRRVFKLKTGEDLPETHAAMEAWAVNRYGDYTNNAQRVVALDKTLRGFPMEYAKDTTFNRGLARASKVLRDGTHIAVMGDPRAGINQAIEGAAIFANPELSLAFINRVLPDTADAYKAFKKGEMPKHELLAHIMEQRGIGLQSAVRDFGSRINTDDASMRRLSRAEAMTQAAAHKMSKHISNEIPLTEMTNALAEAGAIGRFILEAEGNAGAKLNTDRLSALGLDDKMNERILTQIRRHGQKNESGEIVHPREFEWDDIDAAVAYREAVSIAMKRVTNYGDQTTLGAWASTWWGKLLTQLQRFSLNAQGNVAQSQLRFSDVGALKVMVAQSAAGMLTFTVGALLAAPAQEDPEAYLQKRLSPKNVAVSALGRAAWTGMMPRAYDVASASLGYDPTFAVTRSANISRDNGALSLAFNFPALDTISSMAGSPDALTNLLPGGKSFSDRDFDTLWKASMLPTTLQVHRAIRNALDLPERSE